VTQQRIVGFRGRIGKSLQVHRNFLHQKTISLRKDLHFYVCVDILTGTDICTCAYVSP